MMSRSRRSCLQAPLGGLQVDGGAAPRPTRKSRSSRSGETSSRSEMRSAMSRQACVGLGDGALGPDAVLACLRQRVFRGPEGAVRLRQPGLGDRQAVGCVAAPLFGRLDRVENGLAFARDVARQGRQPLELGLDLRSFGLRRRRSGGGRHPGARSTRPSPRRPLRSRRRRPWASRSRDVRVAWRSTSTARRCPSSSRKSAIGARKASMSGTASNSSAVERRSAPVSARSVSIPAWASDNAFEPGVLFGGATAGFRVNVPRLVEGGVGLLTRLCAPRVRLRPPRRRPREAGPPGPSRRPRRPLLRSAGREHP